MFIRRFFPFFLCVAWGLPASAATYTPDGDVIGDVTHYTVRQEDNLYEIARRFDIGIVELLAANPGIDAWTPEEGAKLTLTTQHILPPVQEGIVLNLSELRLFYFVENGKVLTFPIGIGREGWQTPLGVTKILRKRPQPVWTPPPSIREEDPDLPETVPAGPDNPLGAYALDLGFKGVLIHGTNRPYGVGKRSSHGCIRLYPEDIETLFDSVSVGTKVTIIDMPYRVGWKGDALYLEIMPTQQQGDAIAAYRQPAPMSITEVDDAIEAAANGVEVDRYAVDEAIARRDGIPVLIGQKIRR